MTRLSVDTRSRIITLRRQGFSQRYTARLLGVSLGSVQRWGPRGSALSLRRTGARGGRRPAASNGQVAAVRRILQQHPHTGSRKIVHIVREQTGLRVTDRTIRNYSASFDFVWGRASFKPELNASQRQRRLAFARAHSDENWDTWIFSDEKRFTISPAPMGVRYLAGQRPVVGRRAYPAKTNVWWAISKKRGFVPVFFRENLNADGYIEILEQRLPRCRRIRWIFMQDGAPPHRARKTQKWLGDHHIRWEQHWPANSPDLNPIENLWAVLCRYVYSVPINDVDHLEQRIREAVNTLSPQTVANAINSMPDRLAAVRCNRGGNTRY